MHMYICIHMCMCVYIYIYVYTHMYIYINTYYTIAIKWEGGAEQRAHLRSSWMWCLRMWGLNMIVYLSTLNN